MTDAELHLLTGAYALDALDPDERLVFEEHLAHCTACAAEVRELQATAAALATASAIEAPESLRSAVRGAAATTAQEAPGAPTRSVVAPRTRRTIALLGLAAAALAVALVGVGALAAAVHRTNEALVAQAAGISAVLTAPDAATATSTAGSGRGTVVTSRERAESVFIGSGLPVPAPDKTYQLWYIDAQGTARSAGTFVPGSDGAVVRQLDGSTPASTTTIGVTLEPAGGSTAPTSAPVIAVSLPA
jgi:anti-sigma-K factor RskA